MTRKRVIRTAAGILIMILLTLLGIEAALWFIDPLGISQHLYNMSQIITIPNSEGFTQSPGQQVFRHWSYTIDENGNRIMPPSTSSCTIAFMGDSVTFGYGVNDTETFPYQLAQEFPSVAFINYGKIAYNIANIAWSIDLHPADGYFYLMIDNDDGLPWGRPPSDYGIPRNPLPRFSAIRYYIEAFRDANGPSINDRPEFLRIFNVLWARDDIAIVSTDSELSQAAAVLQPTLLTFPRWAFTDQVSWIDWHPNAAGHRYLAEQVREPLQALIARRCPGTVFERSATADG